MLHWNFLAYHVYHCKNFLFALALEGKYWMGFRNALFWHVEMLKKFSNLGPRTAVFRNYMLHSWMKILLRRAQLHKLETINSVRQRQHIEFFEFALGKGVGIRYIFCSRYWKVESHFGRDSLCSAMSSAAPMMASHSNSESEVGHKWWQLTIRNVNLLVSIIYAKNDKRITNISVKLIVDFAKSWKN